MRSHIPNMLSIDPIKHGWNENNGILEPVLTTKDPIPNDIRKLLTIFCTDKLCQNNRCVCLKEGLKCCLDCSCDNHINCNNSLQYSDENADDNI